MSDASPQWWIRLSNGKVRGPFPPSKVIKAWGSGQVPNDASFGPSASGPFLPIDRCSPSAMPINPPPVPQATWFVARNGVRSGPFTELELEKLARSGDVASSDLVWTKGMASWSRAGDTSQLASTFARDDLLPPPLPDEAAHAFPGTSTTATDGFFGSLEASASTAEVGMAPPQKPPAEFRGSRGGGDDIWALCALLLPVISAGGLWFWVENLRVIDVLQRNPMQTFWTVLGLTLIGCGAFVALDASKLGIGGPDDLTSKGKRRANGPGHWGALVLMLFLIGYPSYMAIRSRRGASNYLFAAVVVMSGFILATLYIGAGLSAAMRQKGF